jgi:hypothetical protein
VPLFLIARITVRVLIFGNLAIRLGQRDVLGDAPVRESAAKRPARGIDERAGCFSAPRDSAQRTIPLQVGGVKKSERRRSTNPEINVD